MEYALEESFMQQSTAFMRTGTMPETVYSL